ncbi:hypothetical protein LWI29_037029 [Acer saccharum]|uniref:Uncharacterized protein n=1 Tax=Acer saccharum TaxID=4024 RepID=A0AA39VCJ8_ACESA|nr:hypothetical protein LWI29_037029 [Acer saccharum]
MASPSKLPASTQDVPPPSMPASSGSLFASSYLPGSQKEDSAASSQSINGKKRNRAKGTVETITTLIGGIINGVVITTNGIHKEEINSIGTIRTIRTIRGNRGFGRNQWGHQNNNQPSHNNQSLQVYNPDEDQRMVSIEASIKKLSTQLGQLHDSIRRQDKGKAPNDHSERINMVTALGGAKQKGKKVAKESEQLSLHKAKNPYRPPINHDKMDEELSKIKLEMGPSHLERLRGKKLKLKLKLYSNLRVHARRSKVAEVSQSDLRCQPEKPSSRCFSRVHCEYILANLTHNPKPDDTAKSSYESEPA